MEQEKLLQQQISTFIEQQNWQKALEALNQILSFSQKAIYWSHKGSVLFKLEQFEEALDSFEKALELDINLVQAQKGWNKVKACLTKELTQPDAFAQNVQLKKQSVDGFGNYKILSVLGQGGMGKVYRAYDPDLKREIALKTLIQENEPELIQRFLKEAEALARLSHPNIIKIHHIGNQQETYYFTMDLVDGRDLKKWLQKSNITMRRIARLMHKITLAIDYAHEQGILHRDLKPANIMINKRDEPVVMDFGLAKNIKEGEISQTKAGIGTPAYMSPEQAIGEKLAETSDVFSLGVVFYELITGQKPFVGSTFHSIVFQIMEKEPKSPCSLDKSIPRDVEKICLKALSKDREKRYQSAREMAKDLKRFLNGEPVMAVEPTFFYKFNKWAVKNRFLSAIIFTMIVSIVLLTSISYWRIHLAYKSKDKALKEKAKALEEKNKAYQERNKAFKKVKIELEKAHQKLLQANLKLSQAHLKTAQYHLSTKNYLLAAINCIDSVLAQKNPKNLAQANLLLKMAIAPNLPKLASQYIFPWGSHTTISNDGKFLAMVINQKVFCWKLTILSKKHITKKDAFFAFPCQDSPLSFSRDGKFLAFSQASKVVIYNIELQKIEKQILIEESKSFLLFSPNDQWLAVQLKHHINKSKIRLIELRTGKENFIKEKLFSDTMSFSPNGSMLAVPEKGGVFIWDFRDKKDREEPISHIRAISALNFSNDSRLLLYAINEQLFVYNIFQKNQSTLPILHGKILHIQFSNDNRLFATTIKRGKKGAVWLWDTEARQKLYPIILPAPATCLTFTRKHLAVTFSNNKKVHYQKWQIEHSLYRSFEPNKEDKSFINSAKNSFVNTNDLFDIPIVVSKSGRFIAQSFHFMVFLWDLQNDTYFQFSKNIFLHANKMIFSPNERWLVIAAKKQPLHLVDTYEKKLIAKIYCPEKPVESLCFSLDSRLLYASGEKKWFCYDLKQKKYLWQKKTKSTVYGIKFASGGHLVAFVRRNGIFEIAEAKRMKILFSFQLSIENDISFFTWNTFHNGFVVGYKQGQVIIWKQTKKNMWVADKKLFFSDRVYGLSLSPNHRYLAVFIPKEIFIYDLKYGFKVKIYSGYLKDRAANISSDWKFLTFPTINGGVALFDLEYGKEWIKKPFTDLKKQILKQCAVNNFK